MLAKLAGLVKTLRVYPDRMRANLELTHGLIHSQQVLLMLVDNGITREDAYQIVQRNAMQCWETGIDLRDLLAADREVASAVGPDELDAVFDLKTHFRDIDRTFKQVGL
jgi:adenylosuccinate lyase